MSEPEAKALTKANEPAILLWQAFARADKQDAKPEDIKTLARLIRRDPRLTAQLYDLAGGTITAAIERTNATPAAREVLRHSVGQVKASLGYERAAPVERLLVEQVALCYLRMNLAEQRYEGVMSQEHSLKLGAYWEKKLSSAQRRYLRSIETLARVRRLLGRPAIQVNIATHGSQQVVQNAGPAAD